MGFVYGYVAAQARLMFRSRSALFWTIVFPLMMTLLFASIWGNPGSSVPKVRLGIVIEDHGSPVVWGLVRALNSTPVVKKLVVLGNRTELVEELRKPPPVGLDAGIVIPRGFSRNVSMGLQARVELLYLNTSEPWEATYLSVVKGVLREISERIGEIHLRIALAHVPPGYRQYLLGLAKPLAIKEEPVKPLRKITPGQVKAWIALSMAVVEALFIGLVVGATSFHEERRLGLLRVILASPVGSWSLLAARLLAALIYTAAASAVAIASGLLVGAEYATAAPALATAAAMMVLTTLFSASMGLLLSMLVRREEAAVAAANALAFPLMFLGGIWIPSWMLPPLLRRFANIFPISRMADAARVTLVYGVDPLAAIRKYTPPAVLAATAAMFLAALLSYRHMLLRSLEEPG